MANIRTANEIIQNLIDLLKVLQPDLDTKPGTVARDLFIEAPANQLSLLYEEISKISNLQSIRLSVGSDLDKLGQNFGTTRKTSKKSSGIALLTFNSIPAAISIDKGSLIFSSNGFSFTVLNGTSVNPSNINLYKSIATKYKTELDFIGITDQYAVEVAVEASTPGTAGNLAKYSLNRTAIPGVSNVTNINPITGGTNQEDDATFRNRILSIFSGSNIGTSLGYKNIALSDSSVLDALVIEPGDPLMTRDGTQTTTLSDGTLAIISEGQGGKVDIIILGSRLSEHVDSFIYRDLSNNNDPTDSKNIVVLGQIDGDEGKTINKKRIDNFKNGILPAQPVQSILEVSGSISGSNFTEKQVDNLGRVTGNYEIIKDTGVYAGSPFGFDKFHWISNKISNFSEDRIKYAFNSQDSVTFTDVLSIPRINQNIQIINENSIISNSDRSIVQLLHTPCTNITRIFNVTTGERYTIIDQNFDGDDTINYTGRVKISGNSLPLSSDILQVDYTWIREYDPYIDYDGKFLNDNYRTLDIVSDSIDWGYSNLIRSEFITLTENLSGTYFSGKTLHNISSIIGVKVFEQYESVVEKVTDPLSPLYLKNIINITALENQIDNIESIVLKNTNKEVYNTASNDGSFSNTRVIISAKIRYNSVIVLPEDSVATEGDYVTILFNSSDVFTVNNITGNFSNNQITIPSNNLITSSSVVKVKCIYVANIHEIFQSTINYLPLSRLGNGFILKNKTGFNNEFISNVSRREHKTIEQNTDGYFYVKLDASSYEYTVTPSSIIATIKLSDNTSLSDYDNAPTITVDTDGYYLLIFNGLNSPAIGDKVLIIYTVEDIKRAQPVTFKNKIIKTYTTKVKYDSVNDKYYTSLHDFVSENSLTFSIINDIDDTVYLSGSDGYIQTSIVNSSLGVFGTSLSLSSIERITSKKVKISSATNYSNNGIYDILSYDFSNNTVEIQNIFQKIEASQISIVRISDGQELWNANGTIDYDNNRLILPNINFTNLNDDVIIIYLVSTNLRQSPTKLLVNVSDQINTSGVLTISGKTINKVKDVVFNVIDEGLKHNLFEAIRTHLNLSSSDIIPSIKLIRLVSLEKVETTTNNEVLSVLNTYDIKGYKIKNNDFYENESFKDSSLSDLEFILPSTSGNISNAPEPGDMLRATFYYSIDDDKESLHFTRNGTIYTDKIFSFINSVYVSSGFSKSPSTKIIISSFNQPLTGTRYKSYYDYEAPKRNERIIIRYNYNKLISDVSLNIEEKRPINADVIVKAAKQIKVDVTINIVISSSKSNTGSSQIVVQNLRDRLISALNVNELGSIIDASDLINIAYSVDGVDRAIISYFNEFGKIGLAKSLIAKKDEYFVANNVIVNVESR